MSRVLLTQLIADGRITDPATPRGRLLAAAARQFRQKGYNGTTVRDLAAEVGILSGSIFHHFKNKEEILFGVMLEASIALTEALKFALTNAETTREKIRILIHNELNFIHAKTSNATVVMVYEWRSLSDNLQQLVLKERKNYDRQWDRILAQAKKEKLISIEPDILRHLIHGAIFWSNNWFNTDGELTLEDLVERIVVLAIGKA